MKMNEAAFAAGQLAERLAQGYFAHIAALSAASDPRAQTLVPGTSPGFAVPVGFVNRKDGTQSCFHFRHFLHLATNDVGIAEDFQRVWLVGSLLTVGDRLSQHAYFDKAPELELVRHLRNGVAHGNKFRINDPARLAKFPAHNREAWVRSDLKTVFEISPALQGHPVLFDFMDAGDVLDILMSVGLYLVRMGNGDPLRP